jgi:FixJ family two-component response regulator
MIEVARGRLRKQIAFDIGIARIAEDVLRQSRFEYLMRYRF